MIDITDMYRKGHITPEKRLWGMVIVQAINDAAQGIGGAMEWLSRESRDLAQVCDMAGIDHRFIMRFAKNPTRIRSLNFDNLKKMRHTSARWR